MRLDLKGQFMARPEAEPKTPLAARLRAVRKVAGGDDRDLFSQWLGISKSSVAHYERGERTPDADVLAKYRARFGVNVNWLLTGEGEMLAAEKQVIAVLDEQLVERLARIVTGTYGDLGLRLPPEAVASEAAALYNELAGLARLDDAEEIEATLPMIGLRLKRRLQAARTEPGTGKREGSGS
jgi:transcriptional regulator with XRE-family HTH domain